MKVREVIKLIEEDGWYLARTRGSHRQFKHPTKSGLITITGIAILILVRYSHFLLFYVRNAIVI